MDHHAGLGDLLEPRLALEHDERAVALGGQLGGGPGDLASRRARRRAARPATGASRTSRPARSARARAAARAGRPRRARTGRRPRRPGGSGSAARRSNATASAYTTNEDADADHEADGARPADQAEQPVDEERGDPDVDDRRQADLVEDRSEELRHRRPSVASRPSAGRGPDRRAPRCAPQAQSADEPRVVGEAPATRSHSRARGRGVAGQLGQPAEQDELVGGQASASRDRGRARRGRDGRPGRPGAMASAW